MDSNPPNSGRRRAALRVKQRLRNDQQRWSPSGKILTRRSRPCSKTISHKKPWNERFIFDEDSVEHGNVTFPTKKVENNEAGMGKRLGSANNFRRKSSCNGKENNANRFASVGEVPTKKSPAQAQGKPRGSAIRHYTERSDGEAVTEFTRCEISPSTPMNGKYTDLTGTRSIGISPFDMAKVRAALAAADEIDQSKPQETPLENDRKVRPSLPRQSLLFSPLDERQANSILDKVEELLYTIELEEELLRRDLAMNRTSHSKRGSINSINVDSDDIPSQNHYDGSHLCQLNVEAIIKYVHNTKARKDCQEKALIKDGPLQYHEIVEILAESILDSSLTDVTNEIEDCVDLFSQEIFQHL